MSIVGKTIGTAPASRNRAINSTLCPSARVTTTRLLASDCGMLLIPAIELEKLQLLIFCYPVTIRYCGIVPGLQGLFPFRTSVFSIETPVTQFFPCCAKHLYLFLCQAQTFSKQYFISHV